MKLDALEKALGYSFTQRELLLTALTHPSYSSEHPGAAHYQRLEFLGDAVLQLTVSRRLYAGFPLEQEGTLSRWRAQLVREESLSRVARALQLGAWIRLSHGEVHNGGLDKPSILADVCEAILAAVYLDGGLEPAAALVERMLGREMSIPPVGDGVDAKTRLQELLQGRGEDAPHYEIVGMSGPPHQPEFTARVLLGERELARATGSSKRTAQQRAAALALERLPEEAPSKGADGK